MTMRWIGSPLIAMLLLGLLAPTPSQGQGQGLTPGRSAQAPTQPTQAATGQRKPLAMTDLPSLPQRVILRPGARIHPAADANAPSQPTPGFGVFYVYDRKHSGADGWVEIGAATDGRTAGWVSSARAMDWKQTMVLAFNNPAGRDRAMFFRDADTPAALWLNVAGGKAEADRLHQQAAAGQEGPVIALEPETYIDITRQFYLLPILSWSKKENERTNVARILEVASAPAAPQRTAMSDLDALRNYKGSVVFVIDTTMSMGPYIERTKEIIRRVIDRVRDTAVRDNFRFGLVAYRDHMGGNPQLEYVTRMVSAPDFAEASDALLGRLNQAADAKANNADFDEDALAGVKMALDDVNWAQFAGRYVILITDAGTREGNDPLSQTRLDIRNVRDLARSEAKQVAIYGVHLKTPEGRANHAKAERQYRALTVFKEGGDPLYYPIQDGNLTQFTGVIDTLTDNLLAQVSQAVGRPIGGIRAPQTPQERRIAEQSEVVGNAMRLAYLGRTRQQAAPDAVRSFVVDQDLDPFDPQPNRRPLDVRVLLTKNQLSDLANTIRVIQEAQAANRLTPDRFFEHVRGAIAAATRNPGGQAAFQRLSGAFGEYLKDLPYESEIMEFTQHEWAAMGSGRRQEIVNSLDSKLRSYKLYNDQPSLWVSFDGGRDPNEAMYPVPLDRLP
jgi:serine/threonine-protein kinase PpkA